MVLASAEWARAHGVRPLARIIGWASAGVDPRVMGIGPVPALRKLQARTGLDRRRRRSGRAERSVRRAGARRDSATCRSPPTKLNVNGGAIALGHPIGCTGTRIVVTLLHELRRRGAARGLATLCVSGGMGMAMGIEVDRTDVPSIPRQRPGGWRLGARRADALMRIAVIPGDGIGKDVTAEAVKVLNAVCAASGKSLDLQHLPWSADHYLATGETLPADGYRRAARRLRGGARRRARRSAGARQPARPRHPARHPVRARSLRQLPAGASCSTIACVR